MLNSRALDDVAAALWRAESVDAGVPESVTAGRTRDAFDDQSEGTKDRWRKFARHAAPAVLTASMPEDLKGLVERLRKPLDPYTTKAVREEAATELAIMAQDRASLSAKVEELTRERDKFEDDATMLRESRDFWKQAAVDENRQVAEANRIIAEKDKAYGPLVDAAHGLSFGTDWNNGNHAKKHGYRQKLLDALPAARAARDRRAS